MRTVPSVSCIYSQQTKEKSTFNSFFVHITLHNGGGEGGGREDMKTVKEICTSWDIVKLSFGLGELNFQTSLKNYSTYGTDY